MIWSRNAKMKMFARALSWTVLLELFLLVPILLANHAHLGPFDFLFGILAYLALWCHAPGVLLLGNWPSAQETLVLPVLVQCLIWLIVFAFAFSLRRFLSPAEEGPSSLG